MNSYIERKMEEFDNRFFNPSIQSPNELKRFIKSVLQEQQEMILKSFINHIISRKEKGYEDRTIIEELENHFILEGIIRDISE